MKKLVVFGLGGAGAAEVMRFPDTSGIHLTRFIVDWPDALQSIEEGVEDIRCVPLRAKRSRPKVIRKTVESTRKAFAEVVSSLENEIIEADGLVLSAGLGGLTGSVCATELARFAGIRKIFVAAKVFWPMNEANAQSMARTRATLSTLSADCQMVTVVNSALVGRSIPGGVYLDQLLDAMLSLHACHAMDLFRTIGVLQRSMSEIAA